MRNTSLWVVSMPTFFVPFLCAWHSSIRPASAQVAPSGWAVVPPMNWANIKPSDFIDNEFQVPYFLNHFQRIANSVVETGANWGFANIKVVRDPRNNEPNNARMMKGHLAFSYFYGVKSPWNSYYGSPAVR